jgi:hypothetical protein
VLENLLAVALEVLGEMEAISAADQIGERRLALL